VLACDVANDAQIAKLFEDLRGTWDGLDGLVHSIAFAPREALKGDLLEGLTRDGFRIAHDVSSYSLAALTRAALPLMENRKAAVLTLTYLGAQRSVPNYNVMGLAKASLEANRKLQLDKETELRLKEINAPLDQYIRTAQEIMGQSKENQ